MENLGTIVSVVEERPTHLSQKTGTLHAGNTLRFLDLNLVNHIGEEKVIRLQLPADVSQEVSDFYAR